MPDFGCIVLKHRIRSPTFFLPRPRDDLWRSALLRIISLAILPPHSVGGGFPILESRGPTEMTRSRYQSESAPTKLLKPRTNKHRARSVLKDILTRTWA